MEKMHQTKARDYPPDKYCRKDWEIGGGFILDIMAKCDAVWMYNGDPKSPHAELTEGKCSNGFF